METKLKILHLEDLQSDSELITMQLNKANIQFENVTVDTKEEFVTALNKFAPDIVLADHSVASFNSMEALKVVKASNIDIPFLLVTAAASDEMVSDIIKEGAEGYILKDNLDSLPDAIRNAMNNVYSKAHNYPVTEVIFPEEKQYDLRLLEEMDDNDYLSEILSIFLDETPRELKDMQLAASSKKLNIVSNKAHKLKSNAGLIEANKLFTILEQIEIKCKSENQNNAIVSLVDAARQEYQTIGVSLATYLKNLPRN